jgi:hypothetical protein
MARMIELTTPLGNATPLSRGVRERGGSQLSRDRVVRSLRAPRSLADSFLGTIIEHAGLRQSLR